MFNEICNYTKFKILLFKKLIKIWIFKNVNTYRLIPQFSLTSIFALLDIFSCSSLRPTFTHFYSKSSISDLLFFHKSKFSSSFELLIKIWFTLTSLRIIFITAFKILVIIIVLITHRFIKVWKIFFLIFI
jgi:hypothetical protein